MHRYLLPAVMVALAAVLAIGAIGDHRWKQRRLERAEVLEWYCMHQGTHCGGPSSSRMERNWNRRQLAYEVAVAALAGGGLAVAAARTLRR